MKTIGTILAAICAVLVVVSGTTGLLLFNIERNAFSPEPYKRAFDKLGLYDRMPSILASSLFQSPGSVNGTDNPIWALMNSGGLDSGLAFLVPPTVLKTTTDGSLDSVFAYINGESDSAAIPLAPFKDHLAGPAGTDAFLDLLSAQSPCSVEQILQMTVGAISGGKFFLCSPPPEAIELFKPLIQSQLQFTASLLPDEIPLITNGKSGTGADPRIRLNRIRAWMKISLFPPFVLLLVITILVVRNLGTFLNWWGYPLLLTGLISLILSLLGAPIIGLMIKFLLETQMGQITSPILVETLRETTSAVAGELLRPVLLQGAGISVLGFLMIVAALFLNKRMKLSAA